jgi:hypothetical protein
MIFATSSPNELDRRVRCSVEDRDQSDQMTSQKTPTAIPDRGPLSPVLSSSRAFTRSNASNRCTPARTNTAISQPTTRIATAPRICGSCVPRVVSSEVTNADRSIFLPPTVGLLPHAARYASVIKAREQL